MHRCTEGRRVNTRDDGHGMMKPGEMPQKTPTRQPLMWDLEPPELGKNKVLLFSQSVRSASLPQSEQTKTVREVNKSKAEDVARTAEKARAEDT